VRSKSRKRAALDRAAAPRKAEFLENRPWCEIRIPGVCTGRATVIDHKVTRSRRPDLIYDEDDWQPACYACNMWKGSRSLSNEQLRELAQREHRTRGRLTRGP
jgi:5-methylcytosine-specific restriction endonuclease McrA